MCQLMKIVLKFLSKGVLYDIYRVIKAKRGVKYEDSYDWILGKRNTKYIFRLLHSIFIEF